MASLLIAKTSTMDFDFPNLIGALSDEERLTFYEVLAHNLTVSVRGIWSDDRLTDGQKVESLKWVNEIMHRVVMKSALLRAQKNQFTESHSWEDIKHWLSFSPEIAAEIEWALRLSYESCRR
jgi:hypothetical protein